MKPVVVGIMAIGLQSYWGQFEGMRERCELHHRVLKDMFDTSAVEIVDVGIVDSAAAARKAGNTFMSNRVDIVFCQMLTYASSIYLAPAVRELNVPVVVVNAQYKKALDHAAVKGIGDWLGEGITCAGVPEATAVLLQLGKTFSVITGHMEQDSTVGKELQAWCEAAAVRKALSTRSLGLLGRSYGGMLDLCTNENNIFNTFGTYVEHLDWQEIVDRGEKADQEAVSQRMEQMRRVFDISEDISPEDLTAIARTAEGLKEMAEDYDLYGFASHYEFGAPANQVELVATLNPAMTLLMTEGIANAPEGDIRAAIAMKILKQLAGNAMIAELYSMDFHDDTCLIGHSGACDGAIADSKAELRTSNVFHGKSGKGYMTQFFPEPGPVTMLALTENKEGVYKLVVAEGMGVEGQVLNLGDTNLRVKFPLPLTDFINRWSMEGPTHHGVLAKGLWAEKLQKVATVLNLEIVVVSRMEESAHE